MERPPSARRAPEVSVEPLPDVVPARAVLTELARGFLLLHERDPGRASKFAATFLREQAGRSSAERPRPRLPSIHRGTSVWGQDEVRF